MRLRLWPFALVVLLTELHLAVADGENLFDPAKRAVLPSEAAASILERRRAGDDWITSEWLISAENVDHLEEALIVEMGKTGSGLRSFKPHEFYRQYMPARWKGFKAIVVNGFDKSASDLFPGRGIPTDQWRRELVTTFGGGCAYWYAVYIVEQNRFMELNNSDGSRRATLICNGPK